MIKLKFWLLFFSMALNVFFIGVYTAERLGWSIGGEPGRPPAMPYEALDLSNEQRAAFEAERDRFHGQMIEIRQVIRSKQAELIHLLAMEKPDRAAINSKQQEILSLQDKLQRIVISHVLDVSAPLSRKQHDRFFALLKERTDQQMAGYPPGCY